MSFFTPATRDKIYLRLAIDGPSGAGKTVTALRFAQGLTQRFGGQIAVVCTERGSARKYVGEDFGEGRIEFDVLELASFSPTEYTAAVAAAAKGGKYSTLVIDSLSHAWEGKDGALETVDRKGKATGWKDVTPMHRRMVDAMISAPLHVLATMRSKTEYVYETDPQTGKPTPRKVGMAPVQRPGMEYEFDVYGSMDWSHMLTITKTRCPAIDGVLTAKPGAAFLQPVLDWLDVGTKAAPISGKATVSDQQLGRIAELLGQLGKPIDQFKTNFPRWYGCVELDQLLTDQAKDFIGRLEKLLPKRTTESSNGTNGQATAPTATSAAIPASAGGAIDPVTPEQLQVLAALKGELDVSRQDWLQLLNAYQVKSARDMTRAQAEDFVVKLKRGHLGEYLADPADPAHQPQPKLTQDQINRLVELKTELQEYGLTAAEWKGLLTDFQVTTAKDLTETQAQQLIDRLTADVTDERRQQAKGGAEAAAPGSKTAAG